MEGTKKGMLLLGVAVDYLIGKRYDSYSFKIGFVGKHNLAFFHLLIIIYIISNFEFPLFGRSHKNGEFQEALSSI